MNVASTSSKNNFRETLECPICTEIFKDPKQLSCGHTFCLNCIEKIATVLPNSWRKSVICPHCRETTQVPEHGLRTNFVIGDLASKVENLDIICDEQAKCSTCHREAKQFEVVACKTCCQSQICSLCALKFHKDHTINMLPSVALRKQKDDVISLIGDFATISKSATERFSTSHDLCSVSLTELSTSVSSKLAEFDAIILRINDSNNVILESDLCAYIEYAAELYNFINGLQSESQRIQNELHNIQRQCANMETIALDSISCNSNCYSHSKLSEVVNKAISIIQSVHTPTLLPNSVAEGRNPFLYDDRDCRGSKRNMMKRTRFH